MLDRLARNVEALLFAADRPLSLQDICDLTGCGPDAAAQSVEAIRTSLEADAHAILLAELAGGWRLVTDPSMGDLVAQMYDERRPGKLSRAAIETLAVVAYNQPCTKSAVEAIRGVDCDSAIRSLLERELIRICGRQETAGRPLTYATTDQFLAYFGLSDIEHLPRRREIDELLAAGPPAEQSGDLFEPSD
jgi:segregation and condensation protein B